MMKRATWFLGGVAAGAAGVGYAKRKIRQTAEQLAPAHVAREAAERARTRGRDLVEAVREGRAAMQQREHELRAQRDAEVAAIDDRLDPGDQLLVDGRPVDTARVIVLRERRQRSRPSRETTSEVR